ncbi:MAG: hypothetical protein EBS39_05935 [Gammaproteobacteria bacterium]|nr:hypothetical protein [Gammaproteobacteria bacterium]
MDAVDPKYLNHLLVDRLKVKRRPVALTYCQSGPPEGYEPVSVVACAIVREAESGRKVFVDRAHHDCWVGQYHLGWMPEAPPLITEGEYLTMAQGFFTPEGARRNKSATTSLPEGSISALAAAPLDEVPEGVPVDVMVCVTDPMRVMQIAGAASAREGSFPIGEVGPSACASIFATPRLTGNSVFATGDGGGRMHNRVGPSEMFVAIPRAHFRYIVELIENFRIDPDKMRSLIMPSHAAPHAAQGQAAGDQNASSGPR